MSVSINVSVNLKLGTEEKILIKNAKEIKFTRNSNQFEVIGMLGDNEFGNYFIYHKVFSLSDVIELKITQADSDRCGLDLILDLKFADREESKI